MNIVAERLKKLKEEQLASVGFSFRENPYAIELVLNHRSRSTRSIGEEDRKVLIDVYRRGGLDVFFDHQLFRDFQQSYPEDAKQILAVRQVYELLAAAPTLLKVFAEWGLGDCLYEVPEYLFILSLFREPQDDTRLTLLEALAILEDEDAHDQYRDAFDAILSAWDAFQNRLKSVPGFPPKPSHPTFPEDYPGIDQTAALQLAENHNCTPGHASILDLEGHAKLMEEFGLLQ